MEDNKGNNSKDDAAAVN